jgi:hypothetical protein
LTAARVINLTTESRILNRNFTMDDPSEPHALNGANGPGPVDIHKPFTPGERIQQLSEIDNVCAFPSLPAFLKNDKSANLFVRQDIASLLSHLSSAMRALATPPNTANTPDHSPTDAPVVDSEAADPVATFKTAQSDFFQTIDRVDKHLTRQILALEEAGIITLRSTGAGAGAEGEAGSSQQQQLQQGGAGEAARVRAAPTRLEPDGMGRYGSLDVGKLNMASSTVERDMERELWRRAREELTRVVQQSGGDEGDKMEE